MQAVFGKGKVSVSLGIMVVVWSLCGAMVPAADALTVATFSDPASDGSTPLFNRSNSTLSGGWNGVGLELIVPWTGDNYPDATFTMSDLTITGSSLSAGIIDFYDSSNNPVLRIEFDGATLYAPFGFGASESVGQTVTFSGPGIGSPLTEETFAFSFANQVVSANGTSWTAAFTSSAVPEPATVALLILSTLAMVCMPRKK